MNELSLFEERWYTVKEMCDMCNVQSYQTFTNFKEELTIPTDWIRYEMRGLRGNVKTALYSESVLKEFQMWLMKNQANQGRGSELVKAETTNAVKQDIAIKTIIESGNIEAMKCLMEHYIAETKAVAEVQAQKKLIETLQPKAEFFDTVTQSEDTVDMSQVAKILCVGLGRNQIFGILRSYNILNSENEPYQEYVNRGYFRIVETTFFDKQGNSRVGRKTVVYQKGLDFIRKIVAKAK